MGYIKQLQEDLIKKIAAGEVIERPASVVKELVENSIDAKATKIEIEIQRAGKYIKVSDNGTGIHADDIDLLFTRHATSKINTFEDLWNIQSMGFRGEALASISAVSKITCTSKQKNDEHGFEIKVTGGKVSEKKSSGIAGGTVFEIEDLFYNVPAREKFLKSESTESGHIHDVVLSLALSHPDISFTLINNKNIFLQSAGSGDLQNTAAELLGNDLNNNLIDLKAKNDFTELRGYISSLETFRSDKKSFFIFINKRPVKCQIISKAIQSAYEGLLPNSKCPVVILNFMIKPHFVDVNVHPSKKEVRYTKPNDLYNLVLHSIQDLISNHYKKEYEEKSVYSLPNIEIPTQKYTEAALEFYKKPDATVCHSEEPLVFAQDKTQSHLFSINNLKCQIIYSDKPASNITRAGNKTIFEVGLIFDENMQVVFSGEIFGEQDYQKSFFNHLAELSKDIYKNYSKNEISIQHKLINKSLDEDDIKESHRKKPPEKTLYEIWERDNWTCVYCAKKLIDPKAAKEALAFASDAFVSYINEEGKKVTNHLLREHTASYDHYLPVSKLPQFNFEPENLFACCFECNRKKSDSMELKSWKPEKQNSWDVPLDIAGVCFVSPRTFEKPVKSAQYTNS